MLTREMDDLDYALQTDRGSDDNKGGDGKCSSYCRCDRSVAGWIAVTLALLGVIAGLIAEVAAGGGSPARSRPTRRTTNVGSLYQGFHQIEATSVQYLLAKRGYDVKFIVDHDYESLFSGLFFDGRYDIIPSVWLPSGHQLYLEGKTLNKDYHIVGTTSTDALFYFMASPAVGNVLSIDDLADPTKTRG